MMFFDFYAAHCNKARSELFQIIFKAAKDRKMKRFQNLRQKIEKEKKN